MKSQTYDILVTGGAGYLGSIMVPELLRLGHKVTVIDNLMYSQSSLLECCINPSFSIVRGDARDAGIMSKLIKGKDFVIPLAALVGAPLCDRDTVGAVTTNRDAIKVICDNMDPEQKLLIPVTNSGYGIGEKDVFCTEESPLNPISLYGRTKMEAEKIALSRENSISLRLATVFGASPRMRMDLLVNDFTYRAVRDRFVVVFEGHFKRNFLHVRDVARAFVHCMHNFEQMKGNCYNVGLSEANLSKNELCAEIKKVLPDFVYIESQIGKDPDKRDYIVSNSKIEKTGYKAIFSIELGIRELVKAYTVINNNKYGNV